MRIPAADGGGMVAVRACFPHTIPAAVRQKSRWITGIALAGWDRLGWQGGIAERWMRLRDRRTILAAMVLIAAYIALPAWGLAWIGAQCLDRSTDSPAPLPLILANVMLLAWRIAMRMSITRASHGWAMALLAPVHMIIGNIVAMMAALRALGLYTNLVHHGRLRWDKTAHLPPIADGAR
ncbi:glycosyltransferase family protein [Sphingomonas abietis]|uniref:Uncharacterized protein n=1 Tax=Sphingomonas abietis TaxID=3012344 RepID=A0ABY7NNG8_9SPHN|nr:hypothetical protein [Sphingomonas abietis]WBO22520.1 hypothetical protein PBT88_20695 [Sphingomonas abietis]